MSAYTVDIIVPVYNVEKYIDQCIKSILNQSYKDFSLILVDDGSKDASGGICDRYKNDNRVQVFHKRNGGLVSAWEYGLEHSENQWVVFVDGDDWIETDYIQKLVGEQKKSGSDIVVSRMKQVIGEKKYYIPFDVKSGVYTGSRLVNELYPVMINAGYFEKRGVQASRCGKLIRKRLIIDNLKFVYGKATYKEDFNIMYPVLMDAEIISLLETEESAYCYRRTEGSMLHGYDPNMLDSVREVHARVLVAAKEKKKNVFIPQIHMEYLSSAVRCYTNELLNPDGIRSAAGTIRQMAEDELLKYCITNLDWHNYPVKFKYIITSMQKTKSVGLYVGLFLFRIGKKMQIHFMGW